MDDELYLKIIKQAADLGFKRLDLRNFGEPLLDRALSSRAKIAKEQGFEHIYINTNGYLLNRTLFEELVNSGMDRLILSLSPKKEFEITRPGIKFDVIMNNLEEISQSEFKKCLVISLIQTNKSSIEEINEFLKNIKDLGLQIISVITLHNWASGNEYNGNYCRRLWDSVTVLQDGRVSLCCMDYEGKVILGDLTKENLKDVVNSRRYKYIRKSHLQGQLLQICKRCDVPILDLAGGSPRWQIGMIYKSRKAEEVEAYEDNKTHHT